MRRAFRALICFAVLLFASTALAAAQAVQSQQITGTVTDPSGAVIPDAAVVVTNSATGLSRTVSTNSDGLFIALNLSVGTYNITTTKEGFKKSVITGVAVDVGGSPAVPVSLALGQVGETVQVTADEAQIQTTTSQIGGVITSTEATQIQLNGRNYIQLLTLQPGVSQTVASGFAIFGTYGVNGNSQSVNGIRTDSANFFIDGVDNKDNGGGGNNFVNISPDSLQQFRNAASGYDASFGGTSGATVSVAIKSGGRNFHGNAYEYLRNDAIQAYAFRPIGNNPIKPPLRYNDFGYTIGGPIWIPGHFNQDRSKLFFFAGQEYKRLRTATVQSVAVPTTSAMNIALAGPTTATGRALAATVVTTPNGTFGYQSPGNNNQSEYIVKVDYNPTSKDQINGHFVHDNVLNVGNPTNYVIYDRTIPGLTSSAQWTHTFNEKTVNTAVGSFSGNKINEGGNIRANPQFGKSILRSDYGLNYATLYNATNIIPQITVVGIGGIPGVSPRQFDNYQRIYAMKDDFSRVIGNQTIKAGAYFWRARKNQTAPPQLNGSFNFSSLANLVAGNFTTYTEGSAITQVQSRFTQLETYVQDDWTLSRRLTLNLGLRWQYMPPLYSWPNNASAFQPQYFDQSKAATINPANGQITANPSPYNGIVLPGTGFSDKAKQVVAPSVYNNPQVQALFHNLPAGLVNTVYNTFAPRVGFAYDLTGQQQTVLRGGFGIAYERVEGNYYYNSTSQVPFISNASLTAGNADNLGSAGTAGTPQNLTNSPDPNLAPPRIFNYSLGVQQKLGSSSVAELNYVGSHSGNLTWIKNLNQGAAGTQTGNPGPISPNALRPYRGYGEIYQYTNGASANYNSLQARMQTRFRQGGLVTLSFTWSQALTEGSAYNYSPQDSFNLHADYGPASYNQPKIFVASYVYPLPFWLHDRTWYKQILGGWQISGLTRIADGLPINVIQPSGQYVAGNLVSTSSIAQRPNIVASPYAHGGKQYLTPAAFRVPALGTYGNLKYDGVLGPLYNNWDVALQKNIPIHESIGAEFRLELFNAPNHLSPFTVAATLGGANADGTYQASNFGQVTAATDPRTLEGVLRIHF